MKTTCSQLPVYTASYHKNWYLFSPVRKTHIRTSVCVLFTRVQQLRLVSTGVKRSGRDINHSPPSGAEVKTGWTYTSIPCIRLHIVDRNYFYNAYKNIILRTAGHILPTFCSGHGASWRARIVQDILETSLFCIAAGATRTTSINGVTAPLCLCCSSRSFAQLQWFDCTLFLFRFYPSVTDIVYSKFPALVYCGLWRHAVRRLGSTQMLMSVDTLHSLHPRWPSSEYVGFSLHHFLIFHQRN